MRRFWLFCGAAAVLFASPAPAEDWGSLAATVTVTSDYRYRGVSGNDRRPALQGEISWRNEDNWHAGIWSSMVDFNDDQNTRVEVDISAGKQIMLRGTIVDLTVTYYSYPFRERPKGAAPYSFFEAILSASKSWNDFTLNAKVAWSPNSFAETGTSWYLGVGVSYQLLDWLAFSANAGRQWVEEVDNLPGNGFPYNSWDAGVTATLERFSLDLRYVDTNLAPAECLFSFGARDLCSAGAVATLSYSTAD